MKEKEPKYEFALNETPANSYLSCLYQLSFMDFRAVCPKAQDFLPVTTTAVRKLLEKDLSESLFSRPL